MTGRDVFLSYCREDRAAARHFAQLLADEGLSVWWDAALHSGETFDEVIERELRAASAAIVLWSPRSVSSRWVRAEATLADRQKKLVPVVIESCDRPIIFELTHTTDLADWTGDTSDARWNTVVQDVRRLVSEDQRQAGTGRNAAEKAPVDDASASRDRVSGDQWAQPNALTGDRPAVPMARRVQAIDPANRGRGGADPQAVSFYDGADRVDMFHCLEIDQGEQSAKRFVVSPPGLKIGRAAPADIIFSDRQVSRSHCLVELADGGLRVSDLNSTNGTYIDGHRISGPTQLRVGSSLRVGGISMKHRISRLHSLQEPEFGRG